METFIELICTKELDQKYVSEWGKAGIKLRVCPFLSHHYLPIDCDTKLQGDLVIFTSKRAVKSLGLPANKTLFEKLRGKVIASTSPSTRKLLEAWGLEVSYFAENAASLADAIILHHSPGSCSFFCSPARREELPFKLRDAGFSLHEMYAYQTQNIPQKIRWGEAKGVLFFSPSAVRAFFQTNSWDQQKLAFAIGPTTTEQLNNFRVSDVQTATNPSMDSLKALIQTNFKEFLV